MTGKQEEATLGMLGKSASSLMSVVSIGVIVFGAGWYLAGQEGGGGRTQALQQQVAVMSDRLATAMSEAKTRELAHADEQRKLMRDVAGLSAQIERLRAEAEIERRERERDAQRAAAETAWLRQQVIELRSAASRGGQRQSDDGAAEPGDIHPPTPPMTMPDTREATIPPPQRLIFR